jgi:hypothetical protein
MYNQGEDGLLEGIPDLEHECLDDSDVMMEDQDVNVSINADERQPQLFNEIDDSNPFLLFAANDALNVDSLSPT